MTDDPTVPPARTPLEVLGEAAGHLAFLATEAIYAEQPDLWQLGKHGRLHTHNDFVLHFQALAQGPGAFANHLAYTRQLFEGRGFPAKWIADALRLMERTCEDHLDPAVAAVALEIIAAGRKG